ncbi:MAG: SdpI family protein [Clostridiaceae bacterium]|nr:SdpI family protein [Clostridiaceae bacterium]
MKESKLKYLVLYAIAVLPLIITLIVYDKLPNQIPMHWNAMGEIDSYGAKMPYAFLLPLIPILAPIMMQLLPKIDPKKNNYKDFEGSYFAIILASVLVFVSLNFITLTTALGNNTMKVDVFVKLMMGVLFVVIGNVMPKLKHNYFVGVKTPWTLSSEQVWYKTHRLSGVLWFIAGFLMIGLSFIGGSISAALYFGIIMAVSFCPVIYSYILYKKEIKG